MKLKGMLLYMYSVKTTELELFLIFAFVNKVNRILKYAPLIFYKRKDFL